MGDQIQILCSAEEMEPIREEWSTLADHPFSHPGLLLDLCEADEKIIHPLVAVALDESGGIRAMAAGRIEAAKLVAPNSYMPIPMPTVRQMVIALGGFMGPECSDLAPALLEALMSEIDQGAADLLELPILDETDPVRMALLDSRNPRFVNAMSQKDVRWSMNIFEDLEAQLASLKKGTRGKIRNTLNRFAREFEDRFELTYLVGEEVDDSQCEQYFLDTLQVEDSSYHRGLGWGVSNTPRERAVHKAAIREGWLSSALMKIDGEPVAFAGGMRLKGVIYGTNTAFVPGITKMSLGNILFFESLRVLCGREGFTHWDFGPGDAAYKQRLCHEKIATEQRTIFSNTFRARILKLRIETTNRTASLITAMLTRSGMEGRVKKMLRDRARGR